MTKSLSKIWLRGFKRLMTTLPAAQAEYLHAATKKKRRSRADSEQRATFAREASRVRPRATAWVKGSWKRAYHSAPPAPGRLVNHLSYGIYVPPAHAGGRMPLVVMLHGCTQTIDEFAAGTRMNLLADKHGFAVAYPEQSKHAHAHRCWRWYDDNDAAGGGEARTIVSLIDALVDEHGFDPERVYLAGMSAGAGLASLLALQYPERFAAVGFHSGPAFGEAYSGISAMDVMRRGARQDPIALVDAAANVTAYPGMPALIVHGDDDAVVAPKNAEQLSLEFLRLNGFVDAAGAWTAGTLHEKRETGVQIHTYLMDGREIVRLCRVADLGHAWAGGDDTVPFHSRKGPDASALFWAFFRSQRRRQTVTMVRRSAATR